MPENMQIASVDLRIGMLEEYNRRQKEKASGQHRKTKPRPCLTLSREYGCEGYRTAELLRDIMVKRTGDEWVLIDKDVLEEVAHHHNISEDILNHLGESNRILDEVLATFSPRWKSNQDCFQLLARHVLSLAEQGNVIIMELGGSIITRHIEHTFNFRIFGSLEFKIKAICRHLAISGEMAENMITEQQKQLDKFTNTFLDRDDHDSALYDVLFNNDRITPKNIALSIADYVLSKSETPECKLLSS